MIVKEKAAFEGAVILLKERALDPGVPTACVSVPFNKTAASCELNGEPVRFAIGMLLGLAKTKRVKGPRFPAVQLTVMSPNCSYSPLSDQLWGLSWLCRAMVFVRQFWNPAQ